YTAHPLTRPMGAGTVIFGLRKDGTEFPAEISISPLATGDGLLVTEVIRDLTERQRAEAKFHDLLESGPDALVIVNGEGQIVLVHARPARLSAHAGRELRGRASEPLPPGRSRAGHVGQRAGYPARPRARPRGAGLELSARRKDGSEFRAEISLSPLDTPE